MIAFIHAKGNSTRVPNKNLRLLGDQPLFTYAIQSAKQSKYISEVIIDSDHDGILDIGKSLGATPLKRPSHLASNLATGDDLAHWQASNRPDSEVIVQVVPTCPFTKPETIDNAYELLINNSVDSVVGCYRDRFYFWKNNAPDYYTKDGTIPNSFELVDTVFETTGLYMSKTKFVLTEQKRMNPKNSLPIFVSKLESVDINTEEDFQLAELLMTGKNYNEQNNILHTK